MKHKAEVLLAVELDKLWNYWFKHISSQVEIRFFKNEVKRDQISKVGLDYCPN